MFGTTLREIRRHVDALASDGGEYYVACARTGDRPIPVAGRRFDDRALAEIAARTAREYRAALRRYDPQLPYHDLIVREATAPAEASGPPPGVARPRLESSTPGPESSRDPTELDPSPDGTPPERRTIEYCHAVASAVFETLSEAGHDAVETAVMDAYLDLAEDVADPDELCVCLLECVATELETHLSPDQQAAVIERAAARLGPEPAPAAPVMATFGRLQRVGLLGSYARSPWSVDLEDGARSVVVRLSGYALSPRDGRLPVLPLVFDLYRRADDRSPSSIRVEETSGGWRVTTVLAREPDPDRPPTATGRQESATDGDPTGAGAAIDPDGLAAVPIRRRE